MYGVENRFKMQLLLGLKGSPLVGVRIVNFVPPDAVAHRVVEVAGLLRVVLRSLERLATDRLQNRLRETVILNL